MRAFNCLQWVTIKHGLRTNGLAINRGLDTKRGLAQITGNLFNKTEQRERIKFGSVNEPRNKKLQT